MTDFDRIIVTRDVHHTDGRLLVQAGATGTIRSRDQGQVGVLFDAARTAHVEPGYNGRLYRAIPFADTAPIGVGQ
ncbi:hypothetical protein J2T57_001504 [Natronocella acetinitrilica]|uniref:Uncharacterized protein n=1 Tax=Natronocella acetinitrilica TaxID=414046 RepID=A0AAE3G2U3_9GAMM|nr:hypothetical protein [Natronocella acetinitrilica]MCP1674402.1 hypothetical protein [Natronocella acetinitrilica]